MDFFEYASIAWQFSDPYNLTQFLLTGLLVGGLCFAIVFIFQAIALYTIATREGYKNKWMAFIPFLNTYYIGVCAQKNRFYNIDTKKIGIAAAVLEFVYCALQTLLLVATVVMIQSGEYPTHATDYFGVDYLYYDVANVSPDIRWAAWMFNNMDGYIITPLYFVYLLIDICLLTCFFQTYAFRRYFLFTITSILFPIQGILFFVVRNNKGVDYKELLRAEQARQREMYRQYQQQNFNYYNRNPYDGNPYNDDGSDPYGGPKPSNDGGAQHNAPDDPFDGLGSSDGSKGSPFDDFDKH